MDSPSENTHNPIIMYKISRQYIGLMTNLLNVASLKDSFIYPEKFDLKDCFQTVVSAFKVTLSSSQLL